MSNRPIIAYNEAKANLDKLCNQVANNKEIVVIERENGKNVAIIDFDELISIEETLCLLRSPENAAQIFDALEQIKSGTLKPQTVEELFEELGIDDEE